MIYSQVVKCLMMDQARNLILVVACPNGGRVRVAGGSTWDNKAFSVVFVSIMRSHVCMTFPRKCSDFHSCCLSFICNVQYFWRGRLFRVMCKKFAFGLHQLAFWELYFPMRVWSKTSISLQLVEITQCRSPKCGFHRWAWQERVKMLNDWTVKFQRNI